MASGDLIVRVRMADVQKFVADAGRCRRPPTRSAGPGSAPGRSGVRRIRSPGKSLAALRRTAFLAGGGR